MISVGNRHIGHKVDIAKIQLATSQWYFLAQFSIAVKLQVDKYPSTALEAAKSVLFWKVLLWIAGFEWEMSYSVYDKIVLKWE